MPRSPTPLHWIKPPRQARTQESLERVLDAAEALLADKRFEDIHVAEIANRADTSVAAFYRRFQDKEALLSNLEKNQELKYLLLEETPWVIQAQDESEQGRDHNQAFHSFLPSSFA